MLALFNPYCKVYIVNKVYIVYKVYSLSYCILLKLVIEGLKTEPKIYITFNSHRNENLLLLICSHIVYLLNYLNCHFMCRVAAYVKLYSYAEINI